MGKPKKRPKPVHAIPPPIDPDSLIVPYLLPYAKKLRAGRAVGFDEKFATPLSWDAKELTRIHDGIRKWLQHGSFDRLAALLKDDPLRIAHPVIESEVRHLAKLARGLEETDPFPDSYGGPLLPEGTRHASRTALLKIFEGMWSAFSLSTILHVKPRKVRGRRKQWQTWEMEGFLDEYNTLRSKLDKLDRPTDSRDAVLPCRPKELRREYLRRMIEVVRQLDSESGYAYKGARKRTGTNTWVDTIEDDPLPSSVARSIAQQAIPRHSLQKHILLAGLFAHYFYSDHTKWKKLQRIIERAEEMFPDRHHRKAPRP